MTTINWRDERHDPNDTAKRIEFEMLLHPFDYPTQSFDGHWTARGRVRSALPKGLATDLATIDATEERFSAYLTARPTSPSLAADLLAAVANGEDPLADPLTLTHLHDHWLGGRYAALAEGGRRLCDAQRFDAVVRHRDELVEVLAQEAAGLFAPIQKFLNTGHGSVLGSGLMDSTAVEAVGEENLTTWANARFAVQDLRMLQGAVHSLAKASGVEYEGTSPLVWADLTPEEYSKLRSEYARVVPQYKMGKYVREGRKGEIPLWAVVATVGAARCGLASVQELAGRLEAMREHFAVLEPESVVLPPGDADGDVLDLTYA